MKAGYFALVLAVVTMGGYAATTAGNQNPPMSDNTTIIDDGGSLRIVDQAEADRLRASQGAAQAGPPAQAQQEIPTVQAGDEAPPAPPITQPSNAQPNR